MSTDDEREFRASSVEEALELGLESLGLSKDQVEVEVLGQGDEGVLVRLRPLLNGLQDLEQGEREPEGVQSPRLEVVATESGDVLEDLLDGDALEDALHDTLDFLEGLLDAMEVDGQVSAEIVDDAIRAEVEGEDVGILIGRRGQTLEAIQELLRTAVRRQSNIHVPIIVDVEGYRERRRVAVAEQAREMARRALEEGEAELDPMPAFERKVVHDTVSEIDGVTSFSEGEEPRRRVVIAREES
ncbi:MAG: RNA-binding cell elongation regulator Jag/EloR [Gaiellales bacterium]